MISFDTTREEMVLIGKISKRAVKMSKAFGSRVDKTQFDMDITATHANGCPLRLADLLAADDFNFSHDVFGIYRHLDRTTGKLKDSFLPRFTNSKLEAK